MSEEKKGTTTEELAEQIRELDKKLAIQQEARHKANSALQSTLASLGRESIISHDSFDRLSEKINSVAQSVAPFEEVKEDTRDIKRVLFGDDKKREKGLVQRFDEVDLVVKKSLIEQRVFFTIMGGIVAVVVFIKGSGILTWLTSK